MGSLFKLTFSKFCIFAVLIILSSCKQVLEVDIFKKTSTPSLSISSIVAGTTKEANIEVQVTTDIDVISLDESSFNFTNCSVVSFSKNSARSWTIVLSANVTGEVSLQVQKDKVLSLESGLGNNKTYEWSVDYDGESPNVTLSSLPANTFDSGFDVTVNFSEPVSNLDVSDFNIINATATLSGSGESYTLSVLPIADGNVSIDLPAGSADDVAGNSSLASNSISTIFDSSVPIGTITSYYGDFVYRSPIHLTINFNEIVGGLTLSDFSVTGGTLSNLVGVGSIYTFEMVPVGEGYKSIQLNANAVYDNSLRNNNASDLVTFYYETTPVEITIVQSGQRVNEDSTTRQKFTINMSSTKVYDIEIFYRLTGNAVFGEDHNLSDTGSFTIPSGQTTYDLEFDVIHNPGLDNKYLQLNLYFANSPLAIFSNNYQSRFFIDDVDKTDRKTIKRITSARDFRCALNADDKALCWGRNNFGQLGTGDIVDRTSPTPILSSETFLDISVGAVSTCAVKSNGDLLCWGNNAYGNLGNNTYVSSITPLVIGTGFSSVSTGYNRACAIKSGEVYCWGAFGGLGQDDNNPRPVPTKVAGTFTYAFTKVRASYSFTCALDTNNDVYCWGSNIAGQYGNGTTTVSKTPLLVASGVKDFDVGKDITGSVQNTCFIYLDNSLACAGRRLLLGSDNGADSSTPLTVMSGTQFKKIDLGSEHGCAITSADALYCWGFNKAAAGWRSGALGIGTSQSTIYYTPQIVDSGVSYKEVSLGDGVSCAITLNNQVKCWGMIDKGYIGDDSSAYRSIADLSDHGNKYKLVRNGEFSNCAITLDDQLKCWGGANDTYRGIGDGTTFIRATPIVIDFRNKYKDVAPGGTHTCALLVSGDVNCWGSNVNGQLGTGDNISSLFPVKLKDTDKYIKIATGTSHSCGITEANVLKCWGSNTQGERGRTTGLMNIPLEIDAGVPYKEIALSNGLSCGLTVAGKMKCWGYNFMGQVGNNTTINQWTPQEVIHPNNFIAIATGQWFTCGIDDQNDLYCWGYGSAYRLGDNSFSDKSLPTPIDSGVKYESVSLGNQNGCAKVLNGNIKCWGYNSYIQRTGAIGSEEAYASTPAEIVTDQNFTSFSFRFYGGCAINDESDLYCWGMSLFGGGLADSDMYAGRGLPIDITSWIVQ